MNHLNIIENKIQNTNNISKLLKTILLSIIICLISRINNVILLIPTIIFWIVEIYLLWNNLIYKKMYKLGNELSSSEFETMLDNNKYRFNNEVVNLIKSVEFITWTIFYILIIIMLIL